MNSTNGLGVPIGVRAGMAEPADARPWERTATVQPRARHVLVEVAGEWVEALTIELRRDGDSWAVRVAHVLPGGVLHDEWLPMSRARPLPTR